MWYPPRKSNLPVDARYPILAGWASGVVRSRALPPMRQGPAPVPVVPLRPLGYCVTTSFELADVEAAMFASAGV